MTIRQQGGVFGRNPAFNNVDADRLDAGNIRIEGNTVSATNSNGGVTIAPNGSGQVYVPLGPGYGSVLVYGSSTTRADLIAGVDVKADAYRKAGFRILDQSNAEDWFIGRPYAGTNQLVAVNDGNERWRVDSSGNFRINTGNLVIGTSGKGIDFSATSGTGTSELFDDYEEGTWTPSLSGYSGTTYNSQSGRYVKSGGVVHIWFEMNINSVGTYVSNSRILGAPFAPDMGVTSAQAGLLATSSGFADVRDDQYLAFYSTGTSIYIYTNRGATRNGNIYRSGVISGQITYPAA